MTVELPVIYTDQNCKEPEFDGVPIIIDVPLDSSYVIQVPIAGLITYDKQTNSITLAELQDLSYVNGKGNASLTAVIDDQLVSLAIEVEYSTEGPIFVDAP